MKASRLLPALLALALATVSHAQDQATAPPGHGAAPAEAPAPGAAPAPAPAPAPAQAPAPEPPKGPAEIFQRTGDARDRMARERAEQAGETAAQQTGEPAAQPPAPSAEGAASPHGASPHGAGGHPALAEPSLPSAAPAPELPTGTIDVEVLSPDGKPHAGADIVLGVMESSGGRTEKPAKTDASGRYRYADLPTGSKQAYRVNVRYAGAKFSSTPFRLPERGGYHVRVPLLATTTSDRMIFQLVGQTVVELKDDRLHLTQQARITNAGNTVFTLPQDGLLVELPAGYTAFQWNEVMTDQKATEDAGKGFRLRGSFPPGSVTLAWAFDLERQGNAAKIPVEMPFRTYTYRIISEAPAGLELSATDFPPPERVKDEGRDLLFTQIRRSPDEPELEAFSIRLQGIPGPGPGRWVAAFLALLAVGVGLWRAFAASGAGDGGKEVVAARKRGLLDAAKQTEAELARGDIGPEYHARRMDEITTELAMLLRDEEALGVKRA
jgi:hypothetical protein